MHRIILAAMLAAAAYAQIPEASGTGGGGGGTGTAGLLGPVTIASGASTTTLTHNLALTAPYTLPGLSCGRVVTVSVTQIVDAANTATVTATAHPFSTNDRVTIAGVTGDTDLNGTYQVTVTGADTFTYTSASVTDATYNNVGITAAGTIPVIPASFTGSTANAQVINLSANAASDVQCVAAVGAVGATGPAGAGDVNGPASSTDNALPRFDGAGGKTLQGSSVTVDDSNNVVIPGNLTVNGTVSSGDGTVAGESSLNELAANGSNYRSWGVPDALTATVRFRFPDAAPVTGQTMLFGTPAADISSVTFSYPAIGQNTTFTGPTAARSYTLPDADATLPRTIYSGTKALDTDAIASTACDTMTQAATGVVSTDVVSWTFNADVTAVTGYAPVTTGGLSIYIWPTADTINIKSCNSTSSSITPGAVSLNLKVVR